MNDLEERLRAELLDAAADIDPEVDADALLASGHRARNNRTVRRIAVGTAFALVAGGLGWAGLGYQAGRGTAPVLATPSPIPSSAMAATPGSSDSVTFGLDGASLPSGADAKSIEVTATMEAGGGYTVDLMVVAKDGTTSTAHKTSEGDQLAWAQLGPRLFVGFVPHRVDWIQYIDKKSDVFGANTSDDRTFDRLDATAVYRVSDKAGNYGGLKAYIWKGSDGVFHNSLGQVVPSATITLSGSKQVGTFFLDKALNVLAFQQGGGTGSTDVQSDQVQSIFGWAGEGGGVAVGGLLLPEGATNPKLVSKGTGLEWASAELEGRLAIVASARMPNGTEEVVHSITYTDAAGKRVTKPLPA
jgi:hypothetical protein